MGEVASLRAERCEACEGGIPPLERDAATALKQQLHERWRIGDAGNSIEADLRFKTFRRAMAFLNRVAEVAESEGHHPDFCLHGWNKIRLTLSTHAIGGLSRNDFILAARIDVLLEE